MIRKSLGTIAGLMLVTHASMADTDAVAERVLDCAPIANDQQRLACYDLAATGLSPAPDQTVSAPRAAAPASPAAPDIEPARAPAASAAITPDRAPAPAPTATPESTPPAAPPPNVAAAHNESPPPVDPVDDFGRTTELARAQGDADQDSELRQLTTTIVAVSRRPRGQHVMTLENGQVWTEKDSTLGFRVEPGDTVVIEKGLFGGFRMIIAGNRKSAVRRVE